MILRIPETSILFKGLLIAMRSAFFVMLIFVFILALETSLAHLLFHDEAEDHFGTLDRSFGAVFLITTLSASAVEDLIMSSWLAKVFFTIFLVTKYTLLSMMFGVVCEVVSVVAEQEREKMLAEFAEESSSSQVKVAAEVADCS